MSGISLPSSPRAAITSKEGTFSYEQLEAMVEKARMAFRQLFLPEGSAVWLETRNSLAVMVALLAGWRERLCMVPVDATLKASEVQALLPRIPPSAYIFSEDPWNLSAEQLPCGLLKMGEAGAVAFERLKQGDTGRKLIPGIVQLTSGSTGEAKCLLIGEAAVRFRAESIKKELQLQPGDKTLCVVPLSHSHGIDCLALPTLLAEGHLFLFDPQTAYPYRILQWIQDHRITFFSSVPQMYDQFNLLDETYDLSSLRHPFCGSAALAEETALRFNRRFGLGLKQGYGLAEIGVICLNLEPGNSEYASVGRPIHGIDWKLLEDGELIVRSPALYQEYLDMPGETAERMQGGYLHTRDLITTGKDGLLYVTGRKDDFISVLGKKVFPREIEDALAGHPDLAEFCAVGRPDPQRGEVPVLFAVKRAGSEKTELEVEQEVRKGLLAKLEDFKVPQRIIWKVSLPKSPLGKVLRAKLKEGP